MCHTPNMLSSPYELVQTVVFSTGIISAVWKENFRRRARLDECMSGTTTLPWNLKHMNKSMWHSSFGFHLYCSLIVWEKKVVYLYPFWSQFCNSKNKSQHYMDWLASSNSLDYLLSSCGMLLFFSIRLDILMKYRLYQ